MVRKVHSKPIDNLGLKLLEEIGKDSRQSIRKISKKAGVSASTVKERLNKFERNGIIKGYSAIVNHEKLGYMLAIIQIRISKGKLFDVEEKIASMPQVLSVYDVSGEIDAIVIAKLKDKTELSTLVKKILSMRYVERTISHIVLHVIK